MLVCKCCGEECRAVLVDFGIGPYEYWGSREFHTDVQRVSDCCECDYATISPEAESTDE